MNRRHFLRSTCILLAGGIAFPLSGGCVAPLISPSISEQNSQPWRCGNCGHLIRSSQDLTKARCPRCHRKGFFTKITEQELKDYLEKYTAS